MIAAQQHDGPGSLIGARSAALIRNYRSLGFREVFGADVWIPLASGGGLAHQILALDVAAAKEAWQATRNRLVEFMTERVHARAGVQRRSGRYRSGKAGRLRPAPYPCQADWR